MEDTKEKISTIDWRIKLYESHTSNPYLFEDFQSTKSLLAFRVDNQNSMVRYLIDNKNNLRENRELYHRLHDVLRKNRKQIRILEGIIGTPDEILSNGISDEDFLGVMEMATNDRTDLTLHSVNYGIPTHITRSFRNKARRLSDLSEGHQYDM